jgi:hypothetical protein
MRKFFLILPLLLLPSSALLAQSPDAVSQYFEGKQVVVLMDMPATQKGVDLKMDRPNPLDASSYGSRIKGAGVAIHNGEAVMITKVKFKDKSIEFQLGGGGYGTFGDQTMAQSNYKPAEKSDREKELERQLQDETDPDRRLDLQRELDYLRRKRERDDARNKAIDDQHVAEQEARIIDARMRGGSRFNLIYPGKVPPGLTPQDVMTALAQYISFSPAAAAPAPAGNYAPAPAAGYAPGPPPPAAGGAPDASGLQKGMSIEQVEQLYGAPLTHQESGQQGMITTTNTYARSNTSVQASFVNGVLVQYSVAIH